MKDKEFCRFC